MSSFAEKTNHRRMSPDNSKAIPSKCYSDNSAFTFSECQDANEHENIGNNREVKSDCCDSELKSDDVTEREQHHSTHLSTVSSKTGSTSHKSFYTLSIPIEVQIDQLLVFSVTRETENNLHTPINHDNNNSEHSKERTGCFFVNQIRHLVLLIGTLCLMMILSNILILNVTIVCMTSPRNHFASEEVFHLLENDSLKEEKNVSTVVDLQPEFTYSPMMKSSLFASMSGGALAAVPFAVYLVKRLGARKAFLLAGILSAISTAFNPMAADFGVFYFIITRIGQGIPLAFCLPVIGSMTAGWSTVKYNGIFVAIATGFVQLAPVFTMPMAGIVCTSSLGWPLVYYIHAAFTILLFTLWAALFKETPQSHQCVTKEELVVITAGKPPIAPEKQNVPLLAIFTSSAVWAIWMAAFANFAGMQLFVIFMPTNMNKVLGLSLKTASILAALPPLTQLFVKLVAAALSDRFHFSSKISLTRQLRLFNTVSSLLGGLLLLILALIPTIELLWSILLLTLASSALGFNTSGVFRSTSLVAKQHAYFVTGVIQFVYCFVLLSMPFAIEALTVIRPKKDWSMVFVTLAFLLTFTNIVFCVFGKGSAASWTESANCKERNWVTPTEMQQLEVREFAHSANVSCFVSS